MGKEIETKVRVDDEAAFVAAIDRLGATYRGAWSETDIFFDHPEQRLIEQDMALRMRLDVPLDEAARQGDHSPRLTCKGPREVGDLKVRVEHEVEVPDVSGMRDILHWMNYFEVFCYQKIRRRWNLDGSEITLDQVPLVGQFAEVEAADEQTVHSIIEQLGRQQAETLTESYVHLLYEKLGKMKPGRCVYADGRVSSLTDYLETLSE